jgi:16S rRNA processing protein RimM
MSGKHSDEYIVMGKITSVYGVKGWVKVFSFTDPMDQILDYSTWYVKKPSGFVAIDVDKGRSHGKGMVTHIIGCDDREIAKTWCGFEVAVKKDSLPDLTSNDYYWHQLEGLQVFTVDEKYLGKVDCMMLAGPGNDVIVVKGDANSIDREERLIPYLFEQVVTDVDLEKGRMTVDWDPEF